MTSIKENFFKRNDLSIFPMTEEISQETMFARSMLRKEAEKIGRELGIDYVKSNKKQLDSELNELKKKYGKDYFDDIAKNFVEEKAFELIKQFDQSLSFDKVSPLEITELEGIESMVADLLERSKELGGKMTQEVLSTLVKGAVDGINFELGVNMSSLIGDIDIDEFTIDQ